MTGKSLIHARWFGPVFAVLLLAPALYCMAKGNTRAWPYNSYDMYSKPWTAEKYAGYHRLAIGVENGEPRWWKPGFEYRSRNIATLLTRAYRHPEGDDRKALIREALLYVDNYLQKLHPESTVTTFYIFRREVQPDWNIKDELVAQIARKDLAR